MFWRRFNQLQPSAPHDWEQPWRSHPLILRKTALCCQQQLPSSTFRLYPGWCWWLFISPHTASTGWRKVLLACQARTSSAVCCSSVHVNWTDESTLVPRKAKRKPGRGAEQPLFIQALMLSPTQTQVNKVNALLMRKASLLLISSALWGGKVILYTVKEISEKCLQRRGCRGMKAPAGEEAEVNGCSCGQGGGGGSCMFTEPTFTLQPSELTPW